MITDDCMQIIIIIIIIITFFAGENLVSKIINE